MFSCWSCLRISGAISAPQAVDDRTTQCHRRCQTVQDYGPVLRLGFGLAAVDFNQIDRSTKCRDASNNMCLMALMVVKYGLWGC